MCGIFCALSCHEPVWPSPELQQLLEKRGPDSSSRKSFTATGGITNEEPALPDTHITLISTVLSLRGEVTVGQPYQTNTSQSTLCWNGEAWTVEGAIPGGNDTRAVFRLLDGEDGALQHAPVDVAARLDQTAQRATVISKSISQIAGPYAFVFYDAAHSLLFYGRDFLGRRSLLTKRTDEGGLLIASVTDAPDSDGWSEVEADGVYCVDLLRPLSHPLAAGKSASQGQHPPTKVPYHSIIDVPDAHCTPVLPRLFLNKKLHPTPTPLSSMAAPVLHLEQLLRTSLSLRILNIPEPPYAGDSKADEQVASLAVLFSGGLDCTVLARLAHDILPLSQGIDLLNVAFENPRIHKRAANEVDSQAIYEQCPDRATGRASYAELQRICPYRDWRFIVINIPYTETMQHRQKVITLMHPHNTEMDLSISYALYFAARGAGSLSPSPSVLEPYTTCARVLLSGLGADELFGGYQRHATAFSRNNLRGLLDELDLDIGRLGKRNLGRDDRVISNWGREARFPYLDEQLLSWALEAPVMDKCGFGEQVSGGVDAAGDGSELLEPGKKVLRCLAWKLGMKGVATEKKRAIQFGARTAKMEAGKTKGTQLLT
ncbi:hypothetical protein LTR85_003292 [Meristemomyces frigidus]|nr:hypothetical protein LTR85_003292 [Meristemomyces frigidus]